MPWEIVSTDGNASRDHGEVLDRWCSDYSNLLNTTALPSAGDGDSNVADHEQSQQHGLIDIGITLPITHREVQLALNRAKNGKAYGFDGIPVEVLQNDTAVNFMLQLFQQCFDAGITPELWEKGIINPIPKNSSKDLRVPLNYWGICLASVVYKLYGSMLNQRLALWRDVNDKGDDSQNDFRKVRSCQDHLATLASIIDACKQMKKETFTAFIDFSKAYDKIDKHLLWASLKTLQLPQKFLNSLQSLYENVQCSVRINGTLTDWFPVTLGLKQGCTISLTLFNLYIDGLVRVIKESGVGGEIIAILLYADDIVLLAESQQELQCLLDVLHQECQASGTIVNLDK